jgi:hypothetical protein
MDSLMTIALGTVCGLAVLFGIGWAGLQVKPASPPCPASLIETVALVRPPADWPEAVQRYYRAAASNGVPRVDSLVVCGSARASFGLWMPLRFRLTHQPGHAFERYMEVTWFGFPVLKAIDRFIEGKGMTGPLGKEATGPEIDQGANMILWAEAPLMPSLWITDERIRWESINDTSARLVFPFKEEEDSLTVEFDPQSGLIASMTAQRYRDAKSGKIPWLVEFQEWQTVEGVQAPKRIAITWSDQGRPWSYWDLEHIAWNAEPH